VQSEDLLESAATLQRNWQQAQGEVRWSCRDEIQQAGLIQIFFNFISRNSLPLPWHKTLNLIK
jgi:hypothetical protein